MPSTLTLDAEEPAPGALAFALRDAHGAPVLSRGFVEYGAR
jgi:hypothetical protein